MNETTEQISQTAHEIQARIQQLSDLSGTNLKNEMDDLKLCLLKNPAACELLLPEDIGLAVAAIKKILGHSIALATVEKPTRGRKPAVQLKLDPDEILVDE